MQRLFRRLIAKYLCLPIPAKASLWFVICSVLQRGISIVTVPIFTRIMSTEQYGVYSTYLSWYNVLIVFTSLNLFYGVFNNAMIKYEDNREQYISSMQGLVATITSIVFVVYIIFKEKANSILGMPTPIVLLLFLELLVTPALQFWTVRNRFEFKYRNIVIVTLVKSLVNPILGIVMVLNSDHKDFARILSVVLVEVIICGNIAIFQFKQGKKFFNKEYWQYAIVFNIPLIPHYLSGTILNQGDRVMISQMCGSSQVAFYSVAYNLGQIANLLTTAITASFTPWIYKKIKSENVSSVPVVSNLLFLMMGVLIFGFVLMGPELLAVVASSEYVEAVYIIPPVAGSVFFIFLYNILANVEFFYGVRIYVTLGSVLAASLNIVLNWFFISKFGYYAAGYTTLFCYIIYGLSHLFFSRIVAKKNGISQNVFDVNRIIFMSIMIIVMVLLSNILYQYMILRYLFVLAVAIAVIWNRKRIIDELQQVFIR